MQETLLDRTYRLLADSDLTYREIADGAEVGFEWLKSLALGRISEPGASKIQRLHDFLAAHPRRISLPTPSHNMGAAGNG